ncbi:hypothetical protein GCM10009665_54200 [Kitasatospora nipponensis]|uniref:Uncharacterized protein n=1 Tax=Kitasatospora nipponensis TaxID=258049 RepID=A0ABN1WNB4_9ACTN
MAGEPTQVAPMGRGGALLMYLTSAVTTLNGPVMLIWSAFGGRNLLITGIVSTVVTAPIGLALGFEARSDRAANRRLDAVGVAAIAEILDLRPCVLGGEEGNGVEVRLRVDGPGFAPFEATWRRTADADLRVGLHLRATVDPSDRLFRLP